MSLTSFRRSAVVLVASATAASGFLTGTASAGDDARHPHEQPRPDFTLTLLHMNDGESALLPVEDDEGNITGGVDRFAELMQQQRAQADKGPRQRGMAAKRGVVSVSGGDNFLPGPQLDASDALPGRIFDAVALRQMGLDLSILGNHDFDRTPDFLGQFLEDLEDRRGNSDLPFLANNLDVNDEPALVAQIEDGTIVTSHVEQRRGEKIGFIGLTTPDLPQLTSSRNVEVDPALAEIANAKAAWYAKKGIDKVILISHLQDIENERTLAASLRGVDIIVGAGGAELLASPGDPLLPGTDPAEDVYDEYPILATDRDGEVVPIVTTPGTHQYVGRLVVTFDQKGELLAIHDGLSRPLPVSDRTVRPDPTVHRLVVDPVEEYVATLAETVIAVTGVALNGVQADVRSKETNLGNLVADALLDAGQDGAAAAGVTSPIVALQNGGGIRNSLVLEDDITALDAYTLLPFSNFVAIAPAVPIATFVEAAERGLAGLPGAAGSFAQIAGYRVTYDASRSAGSRVVDLVLDDGTVIVDDGALAPTAPATISIATIDFLLRDSGDGTSGDGYPFSGVDFTVLPVTYQEAFSGYLQDDLGGVVTAADYPAGGEGRITPIP